jgi:hypothetical protein
MGCTELHIPHKKWAIEVGIPNGAREEQNLHAIERWARDQPCGGGGVPRIWCGSETSELAAEEDLTLVVPITGTVPDYLYVTGQFTIMNGLVEQVVEVAISISNDLGQWLGWGTSDIGFTWPAGAARGGGSACVIAGTDEITLTLSNASTETISATISLQALEVDAPEGACCIQAS